MNASLLNQSKQHHAAGRLADAEKGYRQYLSQVPDHPEALNMLGVLQAQKGDIQTGASLIAKALEVKPKYAEAAFNLGRLFHDAGQLQQAILAYTRVVRTNPKHSKGWTNLAAAFDTIGKPDVAEECIRDGLRCEPKNESLYINGCRLLKKRNAFEECRDLSERGLKRFPNSVRLWIHRAEACFALGKFDEAWAAYAWRFRTPENPNIAPTYPIPEWQGEDLSNKKILVWTEQGPGEVLMLAPCLAEVIALAESCIIVTTARFIPFLARTFPTADVRDGNTFQADPSTADVQCSQIDLARWLRRGWHDFPDHPTPVLCDPNLRDSIRRKYERLAGGGPIVGIAWRSADINTAEQKSIPLDGWRPLLSTPGVTFICLQYGDAAAEVESVSSALGVPIHLDTDIDPLTDMDAHLAQAAAVDLVVSTSNTLVHAAAAQGVPAWCLVPQLIGEGLRWQWFSERTDSPWYPSVTLYRQDVQGEWSEPIGNATLDLLDFARAHTAEADVAPHAAALAFSFHKAGQTRNAGRFAEYALEAGRHTASLYRLAAAGCRAIGETENALEYLNLAIEQGVKDVGLRIDRAALFAALGEIERADQELGSVREDEPTSPEAANNLGRIRRLQGRTQEALEAFIDAVSLDPELSGSALSAGTCHYELGQTEAAIAIFEDLIKREVHVSDAASTLAMTLLNTCNFSQGWPLSRHRLARADNNVSYHLFPAPMWNGEDLAGKNVLVWTEQGIGEELLLATMVPDLAAKCAKLTLLCSERMVAVFKRSFPNIKIAKRDEPLPAEGIDPGLDFQMSMTDVGQAVRPSWESFLGAQNTAVVNANTNHRKKLRTLYQRGANNGLLVGLSWHSATPDLGPLKSLPAQVVADLASRIDATIVSLQYNPTSTDLSTIEQVCKEKWIVDSSIDPMSSMEDAVAQVAAMDCVVTISNTTAHTAGALGIPCALLVPKYTGRHWYWFRTESNRSGWYPSVRMYEMDPTLDTNSLFSDILEFVQDAIGTR